jgi:hypothetical protein
MRAKLLSSLFILLLLGVGVTAIHLPPTLAQGDSPVAALTPTPVVMAIPGPAGNQLPPAPLANLDGSPVVMHLPFSDTFNSEQGWFYDGQWRLDSQSAYDGTGWFMDGTRRNSTSTLTYLPYIDLTGIFSTQLTYRQKGLLPETDFIAVDLSLDGGLTWIMVDQQIGLDQDWAMHAVDLTEYRGQVIRLRFRVSTGQQLVFDQPETGGYWIDDLNILYATFSVAMIAEAEAAEAPIGPPANLTEMGLHLIVGAQKSPVVDLATRLEEAGHPLGTVKGTSGTEDILNAVKEASPETTIVYRSLVNGDGRQDCPNVWHAPDVEAQRWLDELAPYWAKVNANYYELMNECNTIPIDWLVSFSIESMRIAGERGQCLLLFSFTTGQPEVSAFAQLAPVYQYALNHPCQPGRMHGVALHAYGVQPNTLVSESGIYLGLRHRLFYTALLAQLPDAIRVPVYLTEVGAGDGRHQFSCQDIARDVMQYTQELEYDPYIWGFHLWNIGPPGTQTGDWVDLTACLPLLGDTLLSYYGAQ